MTDRPHARIRVADHPVVAHRVTQLRDVRTEPPAFRQLLGEVAAFVAYEALHDLGVGAKVIDTPVTSGIEALVVAESVLLVPILRAGLGMVPTIQALLPLSEVAHVGLRRDERTLQSSLYLDRLPADLSGRRVIICDPMLATGGSLSTVATMVESRNAAHVIALCIVAAQPGIDRVLAEHPDLTIACAAIDVELDHRGYITPGLGDAGDRQFGPPLELA